MEVVAPLGVEAEPAELPGPDDPRVVQVALGDQDEVPAQVGLEHVDLGGQLLEEADRRRVDDGVHGVEPEAIDVVVAGTTSGRCRRRTGRTWSLSGPSKFDRRRPRGLVPVGEIGAELREVVAPGAEVVVDHVEDHAEALRVAGVDEPLQPSGPP